MGKDRLTPKQAAFVREYLVDLNATQAAMRAGYKEKAAYRTGFENRAQGIGTRRKASRDVSGQDGRKPFIDFPDGHQGAERCLRWS